ncbi:WD40/YVTN/BNR-like repeat-containing protein [Flexivirga caeni]|uniref:Glycosyl hydrolase n=1 Tax=Flexivirga caeni TaxID=2294115 RepID=A0A3M9MBI2_9MICO|nr:YCF48-related protein [Flexivirga caeni]RNI22940.1 glycosyl hydrolase [Flexivirga caeni]
MQGTILVATAGQGVLRSSDDGTTWARIPLGQGLEFDAVVRALAVHPEHPEVVYAGADAGLARSDDGGTRWSRVSSPFEDQQVWSIAVDPNDPASIIVGTGAPNRAVLWLTTDAGTSWTRIGPELPEHCAGVSKPRILTATWDQIDGKSAWFGVEEGGLWHSRDRGENWDRLDGAPDTLPDGVTVSDVHCIVVVEGPPKTIVVVVVNALFVSQDDGQTWVRTGTKSTWGIYYTRLVAAIPGSSSLLLGIGDATPGTTTRIFRSDDLTQSWQEANFDVPPSSTVWALGLHHADPDLVFAGTKYGDLYRSVDGGRSFVKEWRSFPEITAVAWTPAIAADAPVVTH